MSFEKELEKTVREAGLIESLPELPDMQISISMQDMDGEIKTAINNYIYRKYQLFIPVEQIESWGFDTDGEIYFNIEEIHVEDC